MDEMNELRQELMQIEAGLTYAAQKVPQDRPSVWTNINHALALIGEAIRDCR